MRLWMALYGMIWIVFLEFLLAMTPVGDPTVLTALHIALGIAIIGVAFLNFDRLRKTRVPGRVKRIAKATANLSVAMLVLGLLMVFDVGASWSIPLLGISVLGIFVFLHVVSAFAIITQAAAVAIAYDMWEDREFVQETEPGVVPAHPGHAAGGLNAEGPGKPAAREGP